MTLLRFLLVLFGLFWFLLIIFYAHLFANFLGFLKNSQKLNFSGAFICEECVERRNSQCDHCDRRGRNCMNFQPNSAISAGECNLCIWTLGAKQPTCISVTPFLAILRINGYLETIPVQIHEFHKSRFSKLLKLQLDLLSYYSYYNTF